MSYNFDRIAMLFHILDTVRPHGSVYNPIMEAASQELREIMSEEKELRTRRLVTPPDGPANSAIDNGDGTFTRLPPQVTRNAGETEDEFRVRQEERQRQVDELIQASGGPITNLKPVAPRSNERAIGDTRSAEELKKDAENPTQEEIEAERRDQARLEAENQTKAQNGDTVTRRV